MSEKIVHKTEYQLSEMIAKIGYISTHQRQMLKGALLYLLHEGNGTLTEEHVGRALYAFEEGRVLSHGSRQEVMTKLFE